jgi:hypothetical protein
MRSIAQSTHGNNAWVLPMGKSRKLTTMPESGYATPATSDARGATPSSRASAAAPAPPTTIRSQGKRSSPRRTGSAANSRWSGKRGALDPFDQNGSPLD